MYTMISNGYRSAKNTSINLSKVEQRMKPTIKRNKEKNKVKKIIKVKNKVKINKKIRSKNKRRYNKKCKNKRNN